ncbi:MAG: hypothetical protein GY940_17830 [bacterium]|nr:hypothetical protein [bacterium]
MRSKSTYLLLLSILPVLLFLIGGCFWLKTKFDPQGHEYAVTLQKNAMTLIAKAGTGEPFSQYKEDVYSLMSGVEEAYEHARTMGKNGSVTGTWDLLRNPQGNRLAKFMDNWKLEGILKDKEYIDNSKKWIDDEFKLIIQLEQEKKK